MRFTEVPLPPKALIVFAYLEVSMSTTSERCDASLFFHIHTYTNHPQPSSPSRHLTCQLHSVPAASGPQGATIRLRAAVARNSTQLTTASQDVSDRTFLATDVNWQPEQWNETISTPYRSPDLER